jgi:thioredoxin 1
MNIDGKTAVVKFWAPWCMPCRAIAPAVHAAAQNSGVELIEVNIDDDYETAGQFGVRSIPMVVGIKDGVVVDQLVGAMPESAYHDLFKKVA